MNCSILKSVIATLLLSGAVVPHATWGKQTQEDVRDAVTSTAPAAQREAIAFAALRTLRHITRARSAIHNNDLDH
jgi:hypothetical protein